MNTFDLTLLNNENNLLKWMDDEGFSFLNLLKNVSERTDYHPEGNSFLHMKIVMHMTFSLNLSTDEKIAALCHDLGKTITGGQYQWPNGETKLLENNSHSGHDQLGLSLINQMFDSGYFPESARLLALAVSKYHQQIHQIFKLNKNSCATIINDLNLLKPKNLNISDFTKSLAMVCLADAKGRLGFENEPYPQHLALIAMGNKAFELINSNYENQRNQLIRKRNDIILENAQKSDYYNTDKTKAFINSKKEFNNNNPNFLDQFQFSFNELLHQELLKVKPTKTLTPASK